MFFETPDGTPTDFASFQASRRRFLDGLAADALLTRIERARPHPEAPCEETPMDAPIIIEGDLVILTGERRLVLGYFSPAQRDVADVVRGLLGFRDEAFGVGRVGRVRISVKRLPDEAPGGGR
jgi:hypothetical protein